MSMLLKASTSARSAARPHRTFVATQAVANSHHAPGFGGCHDDGSRSDFHRFAAAVTAIRFPGSSRSLARPDFGGPAAAFDPGWRRKVYALEPDHDPLGGYTGPAYEASR